MEQKAGHHDWSTVGEGLVVNVGQWAGFIPRNDLQGNGVQSNSKCNGKPSRGDGVKKRNG